MVDWNLRARIADSILDTAGLTPLIRLRRVAAPGCAEVLVKLEY